MAKGRVSKTTTFLGLIALLAILTGISSAQHTPRQEEAIDRELVPDSGWPGERMHRVEEQLMGVPVEMVVCGDGFALQGNMTHLLRLHIERLSPLEPGQIRGFLVSNKSIEEIREAINSGEGQTLYQGRMRLDDTGYPLINIDLRRVNDTVMIVNANVALARSNPENPTDIIGHLNLTVSISKEGMIGQGQMEMNGTEHKGSYHILLDMAKRHAD
jgi:hypothetical protein